MSRDDGKGREHLAQSLRANLPARFATITRNPPSRTSRIYTTPYRIPRCRSVAVDQIVPWRRCTDARLTSGGPNRNEKAVRPDGFYHLQTGRASSKQLRNVR